MGFKRTAEGRVYFQRGKDTANDQRQMRSPERIAREMVRESIEQSVAEAAEPPQMNTEILLLLKSLNDRLKTTQAERNHMRKQLETYRELIEDLDRKTEQNERAYINLEGKLSKSPTSAVQPATSARAEKMAQETMKELEQTRKLLLALENKAETAVKSVAALKSQQRKQEETLSESTQSYQSLVERLAETESRQEQLDDKVQAAVSQQERLIRKIDKTIEDRARFMRKIERIEEAVIQTRDSLNAKAMVLLTDQGVAAQAPVDRFENDEDDLADALLAQRVLDQGRNAQKEPIWKRYITARNAMFAAIPLLIGIIVWAVMNQGGFQNMMTSSQNEQPSYQTAYEPSPVSTRLAEPTDENTYASSELESEYVYSDPLNQEGTEELNDIGAVDLDDDKEVMKLLETKPEELAAMLNSIEPGEPVAEDTAMEEPAAQAPPQVEKTPAPAGQPKAVENTPATQNTANAGRDPALPSVISKVEAEAMKGSAEAQHDLAAIYTAGHGNVKQDYTRAAYWFEKAADQGIPNAAYNLGVLHHQGLGVPADIKKAIYWYRRAADQGHPEARYNLGIAYIEGIGVPYDPQKAAEYFELAADDGVMEAAYNLGLIYENGLLGEARPDEALMWYKTAADRGSPEARAALEQLAKTLEIDLEDVNRLADQMKQTEMTVEDPVPLKKTDSSSVTKNASVSSAPAPAPVRQQAPAQPTSSLVKVIQPTMDNARQNVDMQVLVAQVQEQLIESGLFPGPADGYMGPLTSDAIRSYQSRHDLQVTGLASPELLQHMLLNNGEIGSRP